MTYVNIDVDMQDLWMDLDEIDRRSFIADIYYNFSEMIPEEFRKPYAIEDDAAYRLECITWLRANGWTVEPK